MDVWCPREQKEGVHMLYLSKNLNNTEKLKNKLFICCLAVFVVLSFISGLMIIEVQSAETISVDYIPQTWEELAEYITSNTGTYTIKLENTLDATSTITIDGRNVTIISDSSDIGIKRAFNSSYSDGYLFKVINGGNLTLSEYAFISGRADENFSDKPDDGTDYNKIFVEEQASKCNAKASTLYSPWAAVTTQLSHYGQSLIYVNGADFTLDENARLCHSLVYHGYGGAIEAYNACNITIKGTIDHCYSMAWPSSNAYNGEGGAIKMSNLNALLTVTETAEIFNCYSGSHAGAIELFERSSCEFSGNVYDCGSYVNGGAVYLHSGVTFTMNGGSITNCFAKNYCYESSDSSTYGYGGAICSLSSSSVININDGIISGNTASTFGGGIASRGASVYSGGLNINGGTIEKNIALVSGGGVFNSGTINMNGGIISQNTALVRGGGVFNSATMNMSSGTIEKNIVGTEESSADCFGGGIYTSNNLTITGGSINNNIAGNENCTVNAYGGGIYVAASAGTTKISSAQIYGNYAKTDGGGIAKYTAATLSDVNIENNGAGNNGGGIFNATGTLTFSNGSIKNNYAAENGGGVYSTTTFNLKGTASVNNNSANNGGGIYSTSTLTISETASIRQNTAANNGGGVYSANTFTVSNTASINQNTAENNGGGIYATSTLTLNDTVLIDQNISKNDGGGIYSTSKINLNGGSVTNNTSKQNGGGIYSGGNIAMSGGSVNNNKAGNSGGGIYNLGTSSTMNSSLSNNTAEVNGGGLFNAGTVTLSSSNSVLQNNTALNGGGIYNDATLKLSNSTVTSNNASYGGGIYNNGTATISGGTIQLNNAVSDGGGVYNTNTITFSAGEILSNTVEQPGKNNDGNEYNSSGVYNAGTFKISGSAAINSDNPVFLAKKNDSGEVYTLEVTGTLSKNHVASLNSYYTDYKTILVTVTTSNYTVSTVASKVVAKFSESETLGTKYCNTCGYDIDIRITADGETENVTIGQALNSSNKKIKSIWITKHNTITYYANEENYKSLNPEGNMPVQYKHAEESVNLSKINFSSEYYDFTYFSLSADVSAESYFNGISTQSYSKDADLNLYAQWQRNSTPLPVSQVSLRIIKKFSGGLTDFSDVRFTLSDKNGNIISLSGANGIYSFDENNISELCLDLEGNLLIKGLDIDQYYITEIATAQGYSLLTESITILILSESEAIIDGETVSAQNGEFSLTVNNYSQIIMPGTGGTGTILFTVLGLILIISGIILTLIYYLKKTLIS